MLEEAPSVAHEHFQREQIEISVYYPDHPPRAESALFRTTKHRLVAILDTPCWVCGAKTEREVHHFHAEWADSAGIDWDRMKLLHPTFNWTLFKEATDFIDSEYNMMVLCKSIIAVKTTGYTTYLSRIGLCKRLNDPISFFRRMN